MLHALLTQALVHLQLKLTRRLRAWTKPTTNPIVAGGVRDLTRSRSDLVIENLLLRQQLVVLERQIKRPKLSWWDRALLVLLASRLPHWRDALLIVQPDTLLRWHRDLFRLVWRHKSKPKRPPGRPRLPLKLVTLIRRMARDNLTWGAERICGELLKLGIRVSKSTIQRYTTGRRVGTPGSQTWRTSVRNHAPDIWACDFLQTYDILFRTIFVFVIIELNHRRVVHFGVTRHPTDAWVAQQLREATPFGVGPRYLIKDNDRKYGAQFATVAHSTGIDVLRIPVDAPKANAHCERFLGSLRRECPDFILILGEHHLHRIVKAYVRFYNHARPHQGIAQRIPCAPDLPLAAGPEAEIVSLPVLGGLHHDYRRRAA